MWAATPTLPTNNTRSPAALKHSVTDLGWPDKPSQTPGTPHELEQEAETLANDPVAGHHACLRSGIDPSRPEWCISEGPTFRRCRRPVATESARSDTDTKEITTLLTRTRPKIAAGMLAITAAVAGCTSPSADQPQLTPAPSVTTTSPTTTAQPESASATPTSSRSATPTTKKRTSDDGPRTPSDTKVTIRIGDDSYTINLYDNPTADDLVSQLPLSLKSSNYPGYEEKLLRLSQPLSMKNAPKGDNPKIPEVGYYQPGQWIALYYGPIGYWDGKVPLGTIDATPKQLEAIKPGTTVTLELAGN